MAHTDPTHTIAPRDLWAFARTLICDIWNLFGAPQEIARMLGFTSKERAHMLTWLRAGEAVLRHLLLIEAVALMANLPPPATARASSSARARRIVVHDPENPDGWRLSFRAIPRSLRPTAHAGRPHTSAPGASGDDYFKDPEQVAAYHARKAAWLAQMNAFCPSSFARGGSPERSEGKGDVDITRHTPSDRCAISSPASGGDNLLHSPWPLAERAETLLRVFNTPALYARRLAFRLRRNAGLARRMLRMPADIDRAVERSLATRLHDEAVHALERDTS